MSRPIPAVTPMAVGELLTAHLAVVVQSPDGPSRFRPHDVIREHTQQVSRDLPEAKAAQFCGPWPT
ncbi:hypothetical protein AB0I51_47265 [Streptomyces sp. NPDC050549]|uniref:hypothetical protein n=1 Tax=Streptomyces sp. NPDC050549 TaxID=3155406 RepID=UPI0034222FE1